MTWGSYPAWRRENGAGRHKRNGVREVTAEEAQSFADHESARRTSPAHERCPVLKPIAVKPKDVHAVPFISDSTIRFEMSISSDHALCGEEALCPASQRFDERPKLKTMRRDEFTLEEYRKLHTVGRKWIGETDKPSSIWYRTVTYNMILIACNTGMRPVEMKNLRWRDIIAHERPPGPRDRCLVRAGQGQIAQAGRAQERRRLFRTHPHNLESHRTGRQGIHQCHRQAAKTLYSSLIADLMNEANLREGTQGVPRSTYSFRHTYATLRLQEAWTCISSPSRWNFCPND